MKILVVDDEADIVEELCGFLERRGHDVVAADGVEQARAALDADATFDVVVTDMRMPPGSGVEVVCACSKLASPPAIVLMTGQASESDVEDALKAGACSVLWKPLSLRKVADTLAKVTMAPTEPATG